MKLKTKLGIFLTLLMLVATTVGCSPIKPSTSENTTNPSEDPTTVTTNPTNPEESVIPPSVDPSTPDVSTSTPDSTITEPSVVPPSDTTPSTSVVAPSVTDPSTSTNTPSISDPTTKPNDGKQELSYEEFNNKYKMSDFFGHTNKIKVNIEMNKDELYELSEDYDKYPHHSSPIYRVCDVIFTINNDSVRFNKVGIRLKGNTSRRKFVNSNGEIYAAVHFKFDFNELIDYVDYTAEEEAHIDERTFLGLKKLDIKWNKNYDTSHIKEYVASELYKEYDVKSQQMGFCQTIINGTNMGLYYTYETVDKQFIKRNYPKAEQGGDLYKACYTATGPADFRSAKVGENVGEEDEEANQKNGFFPSYDIKTNKDETDHSSLTNMISVLNKSNVKVSDIEEVVDLEQFIKYEAVSYVLGDPDDLRNNWNNSYIYFNADTKLAEILPYDKDRMFGTQCDWNPTGNGMVEVNPLSNWAQGAGKEQTNPLYRNILSRPLSGAEKYVSTYMNLVKNIFETSVTLSSFAVTYEYVKSLYNDIVDADNDLPSIVFSTSDYTNLTFNDYISKKSAHFTKKYNEWANN